MKRWHPTKRAFGYGLLLAGVCFACAGCKPRRAGDAVLYVSLDEPYVKPVLDRFRRDTGQHIRPVYDTEANKSRGLAERLLAERAAPRADVWWSSEVMQTLALAKAGALEPYRPSSAEGIPTRYRDPGGLWTGFAARCRVIACNSRRLKTPPRSLLELAEPRWKGQVAMANPLFGSTFTEAAALFQVLGPERARDYYRRRRENGTRIVEGNSVAADQAAHGDVLVGQTDTDDAFIRVDAGQPVKVVFPDQEGIGALVIPNTGGLVRAGPHPEAAKRFLDYLLRPETELLLASLPSRQLPLHPGLEALLPEKVRPIARVKAMAVDYGRLSDRYEEVDLYLRGLFLE